MKKGGLPGEAEAGECGGREGGKGKGLSYVHNHWRGFRFQTIFVYLSL